MELNIPLNGKIFKLRVSIKKLLYLIIFLLLVLLSLIKLLLVDGLTPPLHKRERQPTGMVVYTSPTFLQKLANVSSMLRSRQKDRNLSAIMVLSMLHPDLRFMPCQYGEYLILPTAANEPTTISVVPSRRDCRPIFALSNSRLVFAFPDAGFSDHDIVTLTTVRPSLFTKITNVKRDS